MNTESNTFPYVQNPPATVISVLLLVAAVLVALLARSAGWLFAYAIPIFLALCAALLPLSSLMAKQWEKAVVLRFGKLHALRGPGLFVIVPFVDTVLLSERKAADQQLKEEIGRKTSEWGVSAVSVEIRDVAIPAQLQDAMSRQAQAEREKEARVISGSAEAEMTQKFVDAATTCAHSPIALQLRAMNIIYEATKERGSTVLIPSSMVDSFNVPGVLGLTSMMSGAPAA